MSLAAHSKLGPYEIRSALGAGGMGEVYRAHDSRLHREVALKILREADASPDLRSRFEREARAVAALNHPNIVAVYDFGVESGQQYIVSELVEGESLRALLRGEPLPVRRLVEIATQVADGLAAAHAAGVVHRDLKPENIMLSKGGRIKILDFGLARHAAAEPPAIPAYTSGETISPGNDLTHNLTGVGAVLGTIDYMSPEQALGKEVDFRSDQFSFGLLLYEMGSGSKAFSRPSGVETLAAIVREETPLLQEKLPAPLTWIMDRCLQKEPDQRFDSTRDLFRELRDLRDHLSEASLRYATPPSASPRTAPRRSRWLAMYAASIALTAFLVFALKPSGEDIGHYRYTPFAINASRGVWSPDGKAVAYPGKVNGVYQTFLRYLDSAVAVQLTHEAQPTQPIGWSSDRSHVIVSEHPDGDFASGKILSIATVGGEPELVLEASCVACDVSRDGKVFITFALGNDKLWGVQVSDPIGSPLIAYANAPFASKDFYNPPILHFSPDGKSMLLLRNGDHNTRESWLLPWPAGAPPRPVLSKFAPLDIPPTFGWLPDSRHIVAASSDAGTYSYRHLWLADLQSEEISPLTKGTADEMYPAISPDGRHILFTQSSHYTKVLSLSLLDGSVNTLIDTGRVDTMPAWSAKQPKLAWVTDRRGVWEVWLRAADGSERPIVTAADFPDGPTRLFMNPSLSPEGDRLIFTRTDGSGNIRLWISSMSGGAPVRLTNATSGAEFGGAWAPDGRRVAYLLSVQGNKMLMVARATGGATPALIKQTEGLDDKSTNLSDWSPTGEWITFFDQHQWILISPGWRYPEVSGTDSDALPHVLR